jgi:hypothetical protein
LHPDARRFGLPHCGHWRVAPAPSSLDIEPTQKRLTGVVVEQPGGVQVAGERLQHLPVNASTGEITAHALTDGTADDAAQTSVLMRQPTARSLP